MTILPEVGCLTGFTIAITAARRRREFGAALERRGARIVYAPAIRLVPLADDTELHDATKRCIDAPLDIVVATTGIGFRGWMEAADGWGLGDGLLRQLAASTLVARGPKVRGALRVAGLTEAWSPESESSSEVLGYLLKQDLAGKRIAVQLHGEPLPDVVQALREAGAEVVEVPVYRWSPPEDVAPLERLVSAVAAGQVDSVAFTSAPAAISFLRTAEEQRCLEDVLAALRTKVLAACVGPVTAAPLQRADVPVVQPPRSRLGSLVKEIAEQVPARCGQTIVAAAHRLEIRGHVVVMDGAAIPLGSTAMRLLRELVRHPGRVVPRSTLLGVLPGEGNDEHAVEVAVGRLRATLGDSRLIQTVVKRGYRLAYEPERAGVCVH